MHIIIGRQGNQPFPLTEPSISKTHASFHMDEATGTMVLRDENSTNGTYIKAKDGTFRRLYGQTAVGLNTLVRLGARQTFYIKDLLQKSHQTQQPQKPKIETVDISKLRSVYEIYNSNRMQLEAKQQSIMMLRIGSMTVSGILVNLLVQLCIPDDALGDDTKTIKIVIQAIGTILALAISWILVDMKSKSLIKRKDLNERYFKKNYCCPKCGFHFGPRIYENILAEGRCPNGSCRCRFTGK